MFGSWLCCVLCLVADQVWAHEQSWSDQTYLHVRHTLNCNDTTANITFSDGDRGVWTKLGREKELVTDSDYELSNNNMSLAIRNVTGSLAGIYVCEVLDASGGVVVRTVKGVNIDEHLYHDLMDKYRTSIIRGVITLACVAGLVIGVCLIDRFRYVSDEQKVKVRSRKTAVAGRLSSAQPEGVNNTGMVHDLDNVDHVTYGAIKIPQGSTRF